VVRKCLKVEPRLKVVLWSGIIGEDNVLDPLLLKFRVTPDAVVPKPCTLDELVEPVEKLLFAAGLAPAGATCGSSGRPNQGTPSSSLRPAGADPKEHGLIVTAIRRGQLVRPIGNDQLYAFFRVIRVARDGWVSCRCVAQADGTPATGNGSVAEFRASGLKAVEALSLPSVSRLAKRGGKQRSEETGIRIDTRSPDLRVPLEPQVKTIPPVRPTKVQLGPEVWCFGDPANASMAYKVLNMAGYKSRAFGSSDPRAFVLEVTTQDPCPGVLVITSIEVLPVAKACREHAPDIRIILVTGADLATVRLAQKDFPGRIDEVVQKPSAHIVLPDAVERHQRAIGFGTGRTVLSAEMSALIAKRVELPSLTPEIHILGDEVVAQLIAAMIGKLGYPTRAFADSGASRYAEEFAVGTWRPAVLVAGGFTSPSLEAATVCRMIEPRTKLILLTASGHITVEIWRKKNPGIVDAVDFKPHVTMQSLAPILEHLYRAAGFSVPKSPLAPAKLAPKG